MTSRTALEKADIFIGDDSLSDLIQQRVSRMSKLLHDLLIYSRVNRKHSENETFEFSEFTKEIYDSIDIEAKLKLECTSLIVTLPKTALEVAPIL